MPRIYVRVLGRINTYKDGEIKSQDVAITAKFIIDESNALQIEYPNEEAKHESIASYRVISLLYNKHSDYSKIGSSVTGYINLFVGNAIFNYPISNAIELFHATQAVHNISGKIREIAAEMFGHRSSLFSGFDNFVSRLQLSSSHIQEMPEEQKRPKMEDQCKPG